MVGELGEIKQIVRFHWGDKWVELRGDPLLGVIQISLKAIKRILRKEKQRV